MLTRISALELISTPTSNSSDRLLMTRIFLSIPLARRTLRISFTMGRYDSHAVTIPFELESVDELPRPIALAAIIDSKPVPALQSNFSTRAP